MLSRILRIIFTMMGLVLGYFIGNLLLDINYLNELGYVSKNGNDKLLFITASIIVCGFIFFISARGVFSLIRKTMDYIEKNIQKLPANVILFGAAGAIIGLIISSMITNVTNNIQYVGPLISFFLNIIMAVMGAEIAAKKRDDLMAMLFSIKKMGTAKDKKTKSGVRMSPKILDTSVIIDGRIFDLCQTGFIEGSLIIPNFVLQELRHIADSSDSLKRNRGRRGLDILNKIQKELDMDVIISERDFPDIAEVDSKLLKLAQVIDGKVITNDYNLNKVAEFQKVPVLNINELANAIKPVVLPGEEMKIQIIKDGKESGQGIAYLDDGTMIVVEGGKKFIGEIVDVIVTSVLQTAAGRMIFAKQKDALEKAN